MDNVRDLQDDAQTPLMIDEAAAAVMDADCQPSQLHRAVRGRLPLKPWFGSTNLLLYTMAGDSGRWVVSGTDMGKYTTALVDPEPADLDSVYDHIDGSATAVPAIRPQFLATFPSRGWK